MVRYWFAGILLAALTITLAPKESAAEMKKTKKQVEVVQIEDIENPQAGFKVELKVDKPDATYKPGENVIVTLKTNKDCQVTLFNVGSGGKVHIIFPNEYQKDNKVKANQEYRIPPEGAKFAFKVSGPAGEDVIKAIATLDNIKLLGESDTKPDGAFQQVALKEIEVVEKIEDNLPKDPKRWAETEVTIKVVASK